MTILTTQISCLSIIIALNGVTVALRLNIVNRVVVSIILYSWYRMYQGSSYTNYSRLSLVINENSPFQKHGVLI